jgi:hypothetical protein
MGASLGQRFQIVISGHGCDYAERGGRHRFNDRISDFADGFSSWPAADTAHMMPIRL